MADRGAGSPSTFPLPTTAPFDRGAGSPSTFPLPTTAPFDRGAGSPSFQSIPQIVSSGGAGAAGQLFRDEGGQVVELYAEWPSVGPYRIRLVNVAGVEVPTSSYAYSAVQGAGVDVYVPIGSDRLRFTMPPAPPGAYGLVLRYGPTFAEVIQTEPILRVVRRERSESIYRLRRAYPEAAATGPRSLVSDVVERGGAG